LAVSHERRTSKAAGGRQGRPCVRNTSIEDIHAGIAPHSPAGVFFDVKVVTPIGEIPWSKVSRIRDDEMRAFMKKQESRDRRLRPHG
jgi:hypothetical protein